MPECRKSLDRNTPRADEIGVAHVIASDTSECLCLAVAPVLLTTFGAGPGGASRIDRNGPNTILRRQTFDPLSDLPIDQGAAAMREFRPLDLDLPVFKPFKSSNPMA